MRDFQPLRRENSSDVICKGLYLMNCFVVQDSCSVISALSCSPKLSTRSSRTEELNFGPLSRLMTHVKRRFVAGLYSMGKLRFPCCRNRCIVDVSRSGSDRLLRTAAELLFFLDEVRLILDHVPDQFAGRGESRGFLDMRNARCCDSLLHLLSLGGNGFPKL